MTIFFKFVLPPTFLYFSYTILFICRCLCEKNTKKKDKKLLPVREEEKVADAESSEGSDIEAYISRPTVLSGENWSWPSCAQVWRSMRKCALPTCAFPRTIRSLFCVRSPNPALYGCGPASRRLECQRARSHPQQHVRARS